MAIRVVLVDDEPLAVDNLTYLLGAVPDVHIVGVAANALAARELLLDARPDVAMIDVRMPRGTGFDVVRSIPPAMRPLVIVVTAYDTHAVEAFEVEAVDYLEKPVSPRRLALALDRARRRLGDRRPLTPTPPAVVRLDDGTRTVMIPRDSIISISAALRHCDVRTSQGVVRIRSGIASLQARLDHRRFVRVNRSVILHLAHVRELTSARHGDLDARMSDGSLVRISRRFRHPMEAALATLVTACVPP